MGNCGHVPTTIGEEEAVTTERPFQSIKAVERTSAKLSTCAIDCRVFDKFEDRKDSMTTVILL